MFGFAIRIEDSNWYLLCCKEGFSGVIFVCWFFSSSIK